MEKYRNNRQNKTNLNIKWTIIFDNKLKQYYIFFANEKFYNVQDFIKWITSISHDDILYAPNFYKDATSILLDTPENISKLTLQNLRTSLIKLFPDINKFTIKNNNLSNNPGNKPSNKPGNKPGNKLTQKRTQNLVINLSINTIKIKIIENGNMLIITNIHSNDTDNLYKVITKFTSTNQLTILTLGLIDFSFNKFDYILNYIITLKYNVQIIFTNDTTFDITLNNKQFSSASIGNNITIELHTLYNKFYYEIINKFMNFNIDLKYFNSEISNICNDINKYNLTERGLLHIHIHIYNQSINNNIKEYNVIKNFLSINTNYLSLYYYIDSKYNVFANFVNILKNLDINIYKINKYYHMQYTVQELIDDNKEFMLINLLNFPVLELLYKRFLKYYEENLDKFWKYIPDKSLRSQYYIKSIFNKIFLNITYIPEDKSISVKKQNVNIKQNNKYTEYTKLIYQLIECVLKYLKATNNIIYKNLNANSLEAPPEEFSIANKTNLILSFRVILNLVIFLSVIFIFLFLD